MTRLITLLLRHIDLSDNSDEVMAAQEETQAGELQAKLESCH